MRQVIWKLYTGYTLLPKDRELIIPEHLRFGISACPIVWVEPAENGWYRGSEEGREGAIQAVDVTQIWRVL